MCPAIRLVKNTGGEPTMNRSSNDGTRAFALRDNDLRNTRARSLDAVIVRMRSAGSLERRLP
jgi:hypothetical protein